MVSSDGAAPESPQAPPLPGASPPSSPPLPGTRDLGQGQAVGACAGPRRYPHGGEAAVGFPLSTHACTEVALGRQHPRCASCGRWPVSLPSWCGNLRPKGPPLCHQSWFPSSPLRGWIHVSIRQWPWDKRGSQPGATLSPVRWRRRGQGEPGPWGLSAGLRIGWN